MGGTPSSGSASAARNALRFQLPGSNVQSVRPVTASMAAARLYEVLVYSTPSAAIGVASCRNGGASLGCAARSALSGDSQRQAMRSEATLPVLICVSGENFVLPASPLW